MIRPRTKIENRYQLDQSWFVRSDKKIGRPGIIGGDDLITGNRILVKQWPHNEGNATELRELWAHEIRQLNSLSGSADAAEMILPLIDSGEVENCFFLIQGLGLRQPLQSFLDSSTPTSWLKQIRKPENRNLLWLNIKRIAKGLNVLHSQGILHRHLDSWSIFTDGEDEPDFQLGGFEWSLRINEAEVREGKQRFVHSKKEFYTFVDDWHDFGVLVANILGVRLTSTNREFAQDLSFLQAAERSILRRLILASTYVDIDHESIFNLIEDAIDASQQAIVPNSNRFIVACNLAADSRIAKAIARSSKGLAPLEDQSKQLSFIEADLSGTPLLIERVQEAGRKQLFLQGENLTYELKKFGGGSGVNSNWDIAFCTSDSRYPIYPSQINRQRPINSNLINVLSVAEVKAKSNLLRGQTRRWDQYLSSTEKTQVNFSETEKHHAALVLLLLLESEFQRAAILSVSIDKHTTTEGGDTEIHIVPRRDDHRDHLAIALGLDPCAIRMRKLFEDSDGYFETEWILSDTDASNDSNSEKSFWKFTDVVVNDQNQPTYRFQSESTLPMATELYLYAKGLEGTDRLMTRHGRAVAAIRNHEEILGIFEEPRQLRRRTNEHIYENSSFKGLDETKQTALREAVNTLPIYLIQGPPGVGKTRLVSAIADQQFSANRNSRLLFTAQSHQTVDHLLEQVTEGILANENKHNLLIVRCRPKDGSADASSPLKYDLRSQTEEITLRFAGSNLVSKLPKNIKDAVLDINEHFVNSKANLPVNQKTPASARAIESLVLRSANLVFSTTNAFELERLIEEHAHFDMSLVEEAAKATGLELVSPLILSHRRIVIGDHKQLPPFESERKEALLKSASSLKHALSSGWPMVAAAFRAVDLDDVVDQVLGLSDEAFSEIANISINSLTIFQSIAERDLDAGNLHPNSVAKKLNVQHRMHPDIAKVVAASFYDRDLHTYPAAADRFIKNDTPITSKAPNILPTDPLVFIDMPFIQSDFGTPGAELQPRYHNPREVSMVMSVLNQLSARKGLSRPPSLAILSPYKEQVHRINEQIAKQNGIEDKISEFRNGSLQGIHVGTVDSFQGNEADLVIVSLVRNNHRTGSRGLGFLRDARRMNVLLSRAKWQLIIIGSFDYLNNCVNDEDSKKGAPLYFLWRFLENFKENKGTELRTVRVRAEVIEQHVSNSK